METPSGHPSSLTQISTNSKQPKTPHSESSQAASQTQISNIYTQKHKYSHSVPTSNSMHHNSDKKLNFLHILFTHKAKQNPSQRQIKQQFSKTLPSPQTLTPIQPTQQKQLSNETSEKYITQYYKT